MAVTDQETLAEVREHRRTFIAFERLVLFAVLHITLTLACLALAFIGQAPGIALLFGIGGTIALIVGFVVVGVNEP
ncbi:MAG TPA: hypothetical protein VEC60_10875 [Reyranella sp.]|nr:hypothetical protein [Reyranella sp.]